MIERGSNYEILHKKREILDTDRNPFGFAGLRRFFTEPHIEILESIAFKHGFIVRRVPLQAGETAKKGKSLIEITSIIGRDLPDTSGFWDEYKELKKRLK